MSIDTVTPHATVVGAAGAAANNLTVGVSANGMLTIQSGGAVSDVIGFIAGNSGSSGNPGSSGAVTVTGAGSSWSNSDALSVGTVGTGRTVRGPNATRAPSRNLPAGPYVVGVWE